MLTRRKPRQARAVDKVDRILSAARDLLTREGPEAFNTNRIAREAGVAIGSIYEYFDSKQAIVDRLIDDSSAQETEEILACYASVAGRGHLEVITAIISMVFAQYRQNGALYRVLWAMSPEARQVGQRPGERAVLRAIQGRFQHIGVAQPELAAFMVFHLVESLSERFANFGGHVTSTCPPDRWTDQELVQEMVTLVVRYLEVS